MATSPNEGLVLWNSSVMTTYDPFDAVIVRDHVFGNLLHLADSHMAQCRVKWVATRTLGRSNVNNYLTTRGSEVTDGAWYRIGAPFGPFPIAIRPDGSSYRIRIELGGYSSAGDEVRFRAVLAPLDRGDLWLTMYGDHVHEVTGVTATSPAWLTGVSLGANGWTTMIALNSSQVSECLANTSTLTDSAGSPASVQQAMVAIHVYGFSSASATSLPRLNGVSASEWIGD